MIVSNTTPLSSLIRVGRQDLLEKLYGQVVIPEAVAHELDRGHSRVGHWRGKVSDFVRIQRPEVDPLLILLAREVDLGEAEAIALAAQRGADLLIIDDQAGRAAASQLKIRITGTVGVVLAAAEAGLVSDPFPLLNDLRVQGGLWLSDSFLDRLREAFIKSD